MNAYFSSRNRNIKVCGVDDTISLKLQPYAIWTRAWKRNVESDLRATIGEERVEM